METLLELPEDIIYLILVSKLKPTNKDAVQLSLVSKKFFDVMQKRRHLCFDGFITCEKRFQQELSYMVSTLKRYHEQNIHLDSFRFVPDRKFGASASDEDVYKLCIELATKKDLKCLSLWVPHEYHVLAQHVFEVKSLENLKLHRFKLQPERIAWRNLKEFLLHSVDFDEGVFEKIIKCCPLIEVLVVCVCCKNIPSYNFKVANLSSLKKLVVDLFPHQTLELMGMSSCYQNLRRLSLGEGKIDSIFTNFAQTFPQLEYLDICQNDSLRRINISSTSLQEIRLCYNRALHQVHLNVPNVVEFVIMISDTFNPKLSFVGNSKGWISRIRLFEWKSRIGASWFLELNKLIAELKGSEISVEIDFKNQLSFNEGDGINEDSVSSPKLISGVQKFSIETRWPKFCLCAAKVILDGIFWICRPKMIKFWHWHRFPEGIPLKKHLQFHEHNVELFPHSAELTTLKIDKLVKLLKGHEKKDVFKIGFHLEYLKNPTSINS